MGGSGASEAFEKSHYGDIGEMLGIAAGAGPVHERVERSLE